MTTIGNRRRAAVALCAFALLAAGATAGCGQKDDPGVVSADPDAAVSGAVPGGKTAGADVAAFGKCMRDAGFAWWPDPDNSGRINAEPPAGVLVDEAELAKAQQDCSSKYMNPAHAPAMSTEDIEALRQYSKCMRDNGLANFPDPDANGAVDLGKARIHDDTPEWRKATEACREHELQPKERTS